MLLTLHYMLLKILWIIICLFINFLRCLHFLKPRIYELRYELFRNNSKLSINVCIFPCQIVHLTKYLKKK